MAEKVKPAQVFLHLLCIFSVFFVSSMNVSADVDSQRAVPPVWLSKIRQSGQKYWAKLGETLNRGQFYFFPPNTDFTGKDGAPIGAGENIKEAATRSFESSKATVEEAAKSAAEVVTSTAEAVKEKVVRRSVSCGVTQPSEDTEEL